MFTKVLIANRGEIAVRIIRACRELGVRTVAVYSDADTAAPHTWMADEAVQIGPAEAVHSYLNIGKIIDTARATGAQAVHPGYGFLAENAGFAAACRDAGIVFIGPPPEVIAAVGDKAQARQMAVKAGVPVVPGFDEPQASDEAIREAVQRIGLPVLLKAAAGGGGKGMRIVRSMDELDTLLGSARREAQAAFGEDALIVEKLLDRPRHIEVQILADAHGEVIYLGERECSVQRRHQKIIEEAPSPAVDTRLRGTLGRAALKVAQAAGYVNAGTVEFLVDRNRRIFFLEVNARLQVEHPVTELVTGLDLVQQQLRLATGEPLGLSGKSFILRGHALECRIYAEDPAANFAPSPGRVLHLFEPVLPGVRIDSGIRAGQDIPVYYDPILAKIIAWAPDRAMALRRMEQALVEYALLGPRTNLAYLRAIITHPAFASGDLSTEFLAEHLSGWRAPKPTAEICAIAACLSDPAFAQAGGDGRRTARGAGAAADGSGRFADPWDRLAGWRIP